MGPTAGDVTLRHSLDLAPLKLTMIKFLLIGMHILGMVKGSSRLVAYKNWRFLLIKGVNCLKETG